MGPRLEQCHLLRWQQVHESMGEVNKSNGLQRERSSWAGPRVIQVPPQNGCLLGWSSRTIKTPINRMGLQVSSILSGFWILCWYLLKQVRHAWGSNSRIQEPLGRGCDVLGWGVPCGLGYLPASFFASIWEYDTSRGWREGCTSESVKYTCHCFCVS